MRCFDTMPSAFELLDILYEASVEIKRFIKIPGGLGKGIPLGKFTDPGNKCAKIDHIYLRLCRYLLVMTDSLIAELKTLLIEGLLLEDVTPETIDPDEPLFGEGLGLDSIDALEIAVLLDRQYGVKITSEDNRNQEIFASLNSLAAFISANRTKH